MRQIVRPTKSLDKVHFRLCAPQKDKKYTHSFPTRWLKKGTLTPKSNFVHYLNYLVHIRKWQGVIDIICGCYMIGIESFGKALFIEIMYGNTYTECLRNKHVNWFSFNKGNCLNLNILYTMQMPSISCFLCEMNKV